MDTVVVEEAAAVPFACSQCTGVAFATNQALLQHMRIKHKAKIVISAFIDGSGVCPACKTCLVTRLRVLKHLSDKRRTKCSDRILGGEFAMVGRDELVKLDEIDRTAKREAWRSGHTSVPAVGQAKKSDGRRVGHAQL